MLRANIIQNDLYVDIYNVVGEFLVFLRGFHWQPLSLKGFYRGRHDEVLPQRQIVYGFLKKKSNFEIIGRIEIGEPVNSMRLSTGLK